MSKRKFKLNKKKAKIKSKLFSQKNIISLIIVLIMVSSIIAFMYESGSTSQETYNGYEFISTDNKWITKTDYGRFSFDYFPENLKELNVGNDAIEVIRNSGMILISFDPYEEELAFADYFRLELANNLPRITDIYGVSGAILKKTNSTKYDLPVLDCKNATSIIPIIAIYELNANQTSVKTAENCIIISAQSPRDLIAIKDKITYKLIGIMESEE